MQLEVDDEIESVVGVDRADPPEAQDSPKLSFFRRDLAQSLGTLFKDHGVRYAVHLAGATERELEADPEVELRTTRTFLAACGEAEVESVCVLSSAFAYGANPDNEILLEGTLLRPNSAFRSAWSKAQLEELCYDWVKEHPTTALQIVRPCPILGPTSKSFFTRLLNAPRIFVPSGRDPLLQFVHEDDATRAIHRLVKSGSFGVFNLAGDGPLHLSQIAQLAEQRLVSLPLSLLRAGATLGWKLGRSEVPPAFVDYFVHPWLVAAMKVRNQAYFVPRYDSADALLDYLEHRAGVDLQPAPPSRVLPEDDVPTERLDPDLAFAAVGDLSAGSFADEIADEIDDEIDEIDEELDQLEDDDEDDLDELEIDEDDEEEPDSAGAADAADTRSNEAAADADDDEAKDERVEDPPVEDEPVEDQPANDAAVDPNDVQPSDEARPETDAQRDSAHPEDASDAPGTDDSPDDLPADEAGSAESPAAADARDSLAPVEPAADEATVEATDEAHSDDAPDEAHSDDAADEAHSDDATDGAHSDDADDEATDEAHSDEAQSDEAQSDDAAVEAHSDDATDKAQSDDATDEARSDDATDEARSDNATDEAADEARSDDATDEAAAADDSLADDATGGEPPATRASDEPGADEAPAGAGEAERVKAGPAAEGEAREEIPPAEVGASDDSEEA